MKLEDLTGKRFGLLTVIERANRKPTTNAWVFWRCVCDCGNEHIVASGNLKHGNVKSCGCLRRKHEKH
jgi:hypothetical protein